MTAATTLAAAIAGLLEVATLAGVDQDTARAEGEALAATVAEPAVGAYLDWGAQTGGDRTAEDFTNAASRGRRFRAAPTPTMASLTLNRSPHAPAYAKALSDVAMAACTLGEDNPRVLGNATIASAAQLGAVAGPRTTQPPQPVRPSAASLPAATSGTDVFNQVMEQLAAVRERITTLRTDLDPHSAGPGVLEPGPGAFDLSGLSGTAPPATTTGTRPTGAEPGPQVQAEAEDEVETAADAQPEPDPKTVGELLDELDALIGLTEVKAEIHRQAAVLRVEGMRAEAGLKSPTITRHLVFTGNPGTGKTTVARLVGGIYRALGLLSKGQLVEVDRSELVAGYLGQTAMKTAEVVESAVGGVLFIDEAYSLGGDQYGTEAIDTLVKEMEDKRGDLVVIVAGYPVPMEIFIAENPGLSSRFRTHIEFPDYTDDELVRIFSVMVADADYDANDEITNRVRALLAGVERGPQFGNARYVRNLLEAAIGRHAWRLREVEKPTVDELRTLRPEDFDDPVVPFGPETTEPGGAGGAGLEGSQAGPTAGPRAEE